MSSNLSLNFGFQLYAGQLNISTNQTTKQKFSVWARFLNIPLFGRVVVDWSVDNITTDMPNVGCISM